MKRVHLIGLGLSLIFFIAFVVFTNLVRKDVFLNQETLSGLDFDLIVKIQALIPVRLDPLLKLITASASAPTLGIALLLILLVTSRFWGAMLAGFTFALAHALELFLKNMLRQSGPPFQFQRIFAESGFDKDYQLEGYSYPSGHSFRVTFLLLVVVWICYQRYGGRGWQSWLAAIVFGAYAAIVMIAKIAHGAHWSSDIIGGALLGASAAAVAVIFLQSRHKKALSRSEKRNTQHKEE